MASLQGLLKRPSKAEQLELEQARQGSVARLEQLLAQRAGTYVEDDEESAEMTAAAEAPAETAETAEEALTAAASEELTWEEVVNWRPVRTATEAEAPTGGPVGVAAVGTSVDVPQDAGESTNLTSGVPVMALEAVDVTRLRAVRRRPSVLVVEDDWDPSATNETTVGAGADEPTTIETMSADEPLAARVSRAAKPRPRRSSAANTDTGAKASTPKRAASERPSSPRKRPSDPPPPPRVRVAHSGAVHPKRAPRQPRQPVILAACPSCAVLLDPRPTASRRCSQCRERIVVKRLEGGVLYLTGPAAAALEAGQRRIKETARLARIRDRWLAQASAVGASPAAIERIGRVTASEEGVEASRALYLGAANRAFVAANRERRFAEAASIRRAHVLALVRELGASTPATDDVIALYRDAMSAELKAQREFGRDAELVAAPCCDACRVDEGLVVRISEEVKATRLPHASCPKGVCHCRWLPARVAGRRAVVKTGAVR